MTTPTLREAEKAFEAVWMSFDERDFPMTDDTFLDKEACKRIYAAGLAAQSIPQGMQHQPSVDNQIGYNDVPKATDEQGVPTENAVLRCEWKELTEKLAAQEAKCKELEAERPKRLCDYDPVEATIGDMVTNFGFDYTNFKFLAEGITRYNDALATAKAECDKAVESIRECRTYLRGCMNHAFDETPIVEVAKDVSEEFHRNRYQLQCMAKERDGIAKERDAANLLLKRLMCVVVPDNAVPNDMKEFVRDSAATLLKDLWDYLKTDADLRKAEHDAR